MTLERSASEAYPPWGPGCPSTTPSSRRSNKAA